MTDAGRGDLWAFALDFYGRPGVAEACLALQDREGLNVNLLLWCCFLARCGQALTAHEAGAAAQRVEPWNRRVTAPLRAVRRAARDAAVSGAMDMYERLKETELQAERVETALLQDISNEFAAASPPDGQEDVRGLAMENLRAYFTWAGKDARANSFLEVLADTLATEAENR